MIISLPLYRLTPDFISAENAAIQLGISSRRLRQLARQGRVSNAYFVPKVGWRFYKHEINISPGTRGPVFGLKASATIDKTI